MTAQIEDLLHRRTDLSTFLVHFTRDSEDGSAVGRDNLITILCGGALQARNAYGMGRRLADKVPQVADTQRTVCFTETPLEHAWMMCTPIADRQFRFNGYGVAFTKTYARRRGVNPVWYLDITPGHDWLTQAVTQLVTTAEADATAAGEGDLDLPTLRASPILQLTPFIEQMGNPSGTRKEFWWEREWRHVGDFTFDPDHIVVAFAPEDQHASLRAELAEATCGAHSGLTFIDVTWGLERMIGALAAVNAADLGPFPS